jgi:hypothetical protein
MYTTFLPINWRKPVEQQSKEQSFEIEAPLAAALAVVQRGVDLSGTID